MNVRTQKNTWPAIRCMSAEIPERFRRVTVALDTVAAFEALKAAGWLPDEPGLVEVDGLVVELGGMGGLDDLVVQPSLPPWAGHTTSIWHRAFVTHAWDPTCCTPGVMTPSDQLDASPSSPIYLPIGDP